LGVLERMERIIIPVGAADQAARLSKSEGQWICEIRPLESEAETSGLRMQYSVDVDWATGPLVTREERLRQQLVCLVDRVRLWRMD